VLGSGADHGGRISLVDEHVAANSKVELRTIREIFDRAFDEGDVGVAPKFGPLARDGERLMAAVDADDGSLRADEIGGQHGHVPGSAADVENAHAGGDARFPQ
jgi:hypothetical protein